MKFIDIKDRRFGRLFTIEYKKGSWKCICDCGKITHCCGTALRKGISTSCGCYRIEVGKARRGEKHSLERIETNRRSHIGLPSFRKGRTNIEMMGVERATSLSKQLSNSHIGSNPCIETRQKLSLATKNTWKKRKEEGRVEEIVDKIRKQLKGKTYPERRMLEDDRRSAKGIEWRIAVLERDNKICQNCNTKPEEDKNLHAHHIKPWEFYPELRYIVSNGLTLCNKCHTKIEIQIRKQNSRKLKAIEENLLNLTEAEFPKFITWLRDLLKDQEVAKCA